MADNVAAAVQLNALASDLAAASGASFTAVAAGLVMSAANQVQTFAQAYAPRKTGALASSITIETTHGGLAATVTAGTDHAKFMEYGTGTRGEFPGSVYTIRPKKAEFLRFTTKDGRVVYTKLVRHPGVAPRPFMRPAVERMALPMATAMSNAAVITITVGPHAPESLLNAPATGMYSPPSIAVSNHHDSTSVVRTVRAANTVRQAVSA